MPRLIDADALLKQAQAEGAYDYVGAQEIADAPTVDPVRHGRWVYDGVRWVCDLCQRGADYWCVASTQHLGGYCPNCGARMEDTE